MTEDSKTGPQVGGTHYDQDKIQPVDYINSNNLDFFEGNVVKYVTRHKNKNGIEDIKKAMHYLQYIAKYHYKERL